MLGISKGHGYALDDNATSYQIQTTTERFCDSQ